MFRLMNKLKNKKGFTLIELIVVLAVLGIIAAIAIPRFLSVQAQAKVDADYATAASIAKAAELFFIQTGDNTTTVEELASEGYIDAWTDWQSFAGDPSITISTSDGTVVVKEGTNTVYPRP